MSAPIVLHPYEVCWLARFEEERAALAATRPGLFREVHHVGSTRRP